MADTDQEKPVPGIPGEIRYVTTDDLNDSPSRVYTQTYSLQKATKNGCRIRATDAGTNSLGYINLKDHPLAYIYIGNAVLDQLSKDGKLPMEFTIELRATSWE